MFRLSFVRQNLAAIATVIVAISLCTLVVAGCSQQPPSLPQPTGQQGAASSVPQVGTAPEKVPATDVLSNPIPFKDWPEPRLVFVITGQQMGYIEPCGCTGLANQKGGLARRASLIKELRDQRGWEVVPLDVGSQIKRYGKQSEIKFQKTADALRQMGYRAVALGADDLKLGAELLPGTNPGEEPSIFTSANVSLVDSSLTPRYHIVEAGGKKVGVIAVLGDSAEQKLQSDELIHSPSLDALKKHSDNMQQQKCDLYVLLAHATIEETRKLAQEVPIFDLVVTSGGVGEPTHELDRIKGTKSLLAQVGTKGMYAGVVGVFDDAKNPLRYERIVLSDQYQDAPEMIHLLAEYQKQLEQMGLAELGATELPHASGRQFVGSEKCGECHTKAFAIWEKTPHAHATDSLLKPPHEAESARTKIPRHYDPECLSCHVTGWEPQKFYPFKTGYLSLEKTPHLVHNGCENCHGPGSAHVAAEEGDAKLGETEIQKLRDQMKLPLAGGIAEKKCAECHDPDNSPDFQVKGAFEKYWKQVEHIGKD